MVEHKEHDYIEKCPLCKKYLTYAQAKTHNCQSQIVKEISIHYCDEVPDSPEKTYIAHGFDGILYKLVECKNISRRKVTPFRTDEDEPEPIAETIEG